MMKIVHCKNSLYKPVPKIIPKNSIKPNFNTPCDSFEFNRNNVAFSGRVNEPVYSSYSIINHHKIKSGINRPLFKESVPPDYLDENDYYKAHYYIDELWAKEKGEGTKFLQEIVAESLCDNETQGRVMLHASSIDGKTSPAGFYYKLGFRFLGDFYNETCEEWLKNGGKLEQAPFLDGVMYLPKENIGLCLSYGDKLDEVAQSILLHCDFDYDKAYEILQENKLM